MSSTDAVDRQDIQVLRLHIDVIGTPALGDGRILNFRVMSLWLSQ